MTADEFRAEWLDSRPYVVAHTSGSTGKPKEIRLLKADMRASAAMTNRFFGITSGSRLLLCLSADYIAGKMMIVRAMEAGATLVEETPSNRPLAGYGGEPVDLIAVVPSQALWLADNPRLLRPVKAMIVGGGEMPEPLRKRLAATGVNAYASYGMTETCSHVALSRVVAAEPLPFQALSPATFSTDSRGCLVVDAPQFSVRRIVTNDVAELLSPTEFFWKGRYDNVINTGGVKVFPEEIERKIGGIVGSRCYVGSRPSEKWGQEVVLHIERAPLSPSEERRLMEKLRAALSPFQLPKAVIAHPRFQETPTGKILRR